MRISFRVHAPISNLDTIMRVTGNQEWLGNWAPFSPHLSMTRMQHGWWSIVLEAPPHLQDTKIEYKYVKVNQDYKKLANETYEWDTTGNRTVCLGGESTEVVDVFGAEQVFPKNPDFRLPLRVMSFNIRYDNPADGLHCWSNRKAHVAQLIRLHSPAVVCLQEVLSSQLKYLASELENNYSWIGVGRNDGFESGEYSPLLYNHKQLKLLDSGTFWLSETPWKASLGWDAACIRICTWGKFSETRVLF